MTAPMMDPNAMQQTPAPQPPILPPLPNPFPDRPNDTEPQVALIYQKRLSKLFVDPKFMELKSKFPEWATLPEAMYMRVTQALQPPPVLPKGVMIQDKVSGGNIGAEEQAAMQGVQPQQPGQPQQPQRPQPAHIKQQPTTAPAGRPL